MRKRCSLNAELRGQRKEANRTCALGEISQNVEQVVSKVWAGMGGVSRMGHAVEENWMLPQKMHSCRSQNRGNSVKVCLSLRQACFFHFLWTLYSSFLDWGNYWITGWPVFSFFPKQIFDIKEQNSLHLFKSSFFHALAIFLWFWSQYWFKIYLVTVIFIHTTLLFLQITRECHHFFFFFLLWWFLSRETFFSSSYSFSNYFTRLMNYCALFLQRSAEKKAIPHFSPVVAWMNKSNFSPSQLMTCLSISCKCVSLSLLWIVPLLCCLIRCLSFKIQVGLLCIS